RLRRGRPIGRFGTEFRCHPCPKSHIRPEFGSTKQARRGPASGAAKCRRFHPRRSKRVVFRAFLACFSAYQPNVFQPIFWAPNVGLFAKKLERRRARDLVHLLQKIWPPPVLRRYHLPLSDYECDAADALFGLSTRLFPAVSRFERCSTS